jgi:AcrR family transcriptional regulator
LRHGRQDPESELTRAAIVGAALDLAAAEGLEAISLQVVADRIGLSKSGVFSRVGSREALQKAVIEEFGRRFIADVFVPAMQQPKGLPRLDEIVQRWIVRTRDVEAQQGCIYTAGAFELDDREGPLRDTCWARSPLARGPAPHRAAGRGAGHLKADTDPEQLVARDLRPGHGPAARCPLPARPRAAERAQAPGSAC